MNSNRVDIEPPQNGIATISKFNIVKPIQVKQYVNDATDDIKHSNQEENHPTTAHSFQEDEFEMKVAGTTFKLENKQDNTHEQENYPIGYNAFFNKLVHVLLVTIGCIFCYSFFALIPWHNIIEFPEYWYEPVFIWIFGYWPIYIYFCVIHCKYVMEYPEIVWSKVFLYVFLPILTNTVLWYCLQYLIWTVYLGYYQPMPFMSLFQVFVSNLILPVGIWYQVPSNLRFNPSFRMRLKAFFCYFMWEQSIPYQFYCL